jgi:hypothetical protein
MKTSRQYIETAAHSHCSLAGTTVSAAIDFSSAAVASKQVAASARTLPNTRNTRLSGLVGPAAHLRLRFFCSRTEYVASGHNPTMPISSSVIHPPRFVLTGSSPSRSSCSAASGIRRQYDDDAGAVLTALSAFCSPAILALRCFFFKKELTLLSTLIGLIVVTAHRRMRVRIELAPPHRAQGLRLARKGAAAASGGV